MSGLSCLLLALLSVVDQPAFDYKGIPGTVMICNSESPPAEFQTMVAGLISGKLQIGKPQLDPKQTDVSPTNSITAIALCAGDPVEAKQSSLAWLDAQLADRVTVEQLDSLRKDSAESLHQKLSAASLVFLLDDIDFRQFNEPSRRLLCEQLCEFLKRGRIVVSLGKSIAGLGERSLNVVDMQKSVIGLNLIPGVCFRLPEVPEQALASLLSEQPELLGISLENDSSMIISERNIYPLIPDQVHALLGECNFREAERISLGRQADLTQLRRAGLARKLNVDPGQTSREPELAKGSLVIVGGGSLPVEISDKFIELAGGEQAHIVVLPTAVPPSQTQNERLPSFLTQAKLASLTMLAQRGPDEIETQEFQSALSKASGIWFGGGRQWNFVDAYEGTSAIKLFQAVLNRGGVIGGSSAGATIQGEYLVRGHPLGNTVMMAEGYERGFSFLPGSAIDQHFAQRDRFADLLSVARKHPSLLGIGIDEGTALVVEGRKASVIGRHSVHLIRGSQPVGVHSRAIIKRSRVLQALCQPRDI